MGNYQSVSMLSGIEQCKDNIHSPKVSGHTQVCDNEAKVTPQPVQKGEVLAKLGGQVCCRRCVYGEAVACGHEINVATCDDQIQKVISCPCHQPNAVDNAYKLVHWGRRVEEGDLPI